MRNFEQGDESQPDPERDLSVCPEAEGGCGSDLVYPWDWAEEGQRHWRILLRCPDCERTEEGVFEQPLVDALDDALDRGAAKLLGDLRHVVHANMSEEIEFFVKALDADIVTADDF